MTLYESIKKVLKDFLRGEFIKLILKKVLGSASAGGIKGWIIKTAAEYLFDELLVPLFQYLEDKGMLYYDRKKGAIMYRKLEEAKEEGDENTYNDIVDNA